MEGRPEDEMDGAANEGGGEVGLGPGWAEAA